MEKIAYLIASGSGYLIRVENDTPCLTSDYASATRYNKKDVTEMAKKVVDLGFEADIVTLRVGAI